MIEVRVIEFVALGISSAVLGIVLGSGLKLTPPKREDRSKAEIKQMREWLRMQAHGQGLATSGIRGQLPDRAQSRGTRG